MLIISEHESNQTHRPKLLKILRDDHLVQKEAAFRETHRQIISHLHEIPLLLTCYSLIDGFPTKVNSVCAHSF